MEARIVGRAAANQPLKLPWTNLRFAGGLTTISLVFVVVAVATCNSRPGVLGELSIGGLGSQVIGAIDERSSHGPRLLNDEGGVAEDPRVIDAVDINQLYWPSTAAEAVLANNANGRGKVSRRELSVLETGDARYKAADGIRSAEGGSKLGSRAESWIGGEAKGTRSGELAAGSEMGITSRRDEPSSLVRRKRFSDSDRLLGVDGQQAANNDNSNEIHQPQPQGQHQQQQQQQPQLSAAAGQQNSDSETAATSLPPPLMSQTTNATPNGSRSSAMALASRKHDSEANPMGDNMDMDTRTLKCRVEKNLYLDFEEYKHYACANCYNHMPNNKIMFSKKLIYRKDTRIYLYDEEKDRLLLPDETATIRATFRSDSIYDKWVECCRQSINCCKRNRVYLPKSLDGTGRLVDKSGVCPATWDGLDCWPDSPAGQIARHECPFYVYYLDYEPACKGQVTKQCFANGSWFVRNDHEWSDFKTCAVESIYATRLLIGSLWHVFSALVIGPALLILSKMPNRGNSKRVKILSNLLFWLLVNALLAAMQKAGIVAKLFEADTNPNEIPPPPSSIMAQKIAPTNGGLISNKVALNNELERNELLHSRKRRQIRSLINDDGGDNINNNSSSSSGNNNSNLAPQILVYERRLIEAKLHYDKLNNHSSSQFGNATTPPTVTRPPAHRDAHDDGLGRLSGQAGRLFAGQDGASEPATISGPQFRGQQLSGNEGRPISWLSTKNQPELDKPSSVRQPGAPPAHIQASKAEMRAQSSLTWPEGTDGAGVERVGIWPEPGAEAAAVSSSNKDQAVGETLGRGVDDGNAFDDGDSNHIGRVNGADNKDAPKSNRGFWSSLMSSISCESSRNQARVKRNAPERVRLKKQQPFIVIICWTLAVGIRITRLLGYAWMFTGAVYLCSILHFAPAEPPATFIKVIMFITNAFPAVIGLTYVLMRTYIDPSPLNLIFKLPYYHFIGDRKYIDYLWATQLECWLQPSKNEHIEDIADSPNLVLIVLNGGLFVVTLIIMCRITRPGSTRPEMSLPDYCRAAGTLVFLYGAHYALLSYRPEFDDCITSQVLYYAFLFVDGLQGISVAYVFCYRTQEGKEVVRKWWYSKKGCGYFYRSICNSNSEVPKERFHTNSRSNQSTRSNNSACNGNEMATELFDVNDNTIPTRC